MKQYNLRRKHRPADRDAEGNVIEEYDEAVQIEAIIWQASGKLQLEMYGERIQCIKNMEYEGTEAMQEGDGICINVEAEEDPDYKILSINSDSMPKRMELEKIRYGN